MAGGSGIIGAEYARRTPNLQATLFDLPPTIDAAREILREEGLEDCVTFHPGDYRGDPFPGPVDALLLDVLQTESEEQGLEILRKAWEAVRPGGRSWCTASCLPERRRRRPPSSPCGCSSRSTRGAWSVEQVTEWLAREQFAVRATRSLGHPFQSTLIVASRLE